MPDEMARRDASDPTSGEPKARRIQINGSKHFSRNCMQCHILEPNKLVKTWSIIETLELKLQSPGWLM